MTEESRIYSKTISNEELEEVIGILHPKLEHIDITGGEPFMVGKELFRLLDFCKVKFEDTEFYAPANPNSVLKNEFNFYNRIPVESLMIAHHSYVENRK